MIDHAGETAVAKQEGCAERCKLGAAEDVERAIAARRARLKDESLRTECVQTCGRWAADGELEKLCGVECDTKIAHRLRGDERRGDGGGGGRRCGHCGLARGETTGGIPRRRTCSGNREPSNL